MAEELPLPEPVTDDPAAPPFALPKHPSPPEGLHRRYLLSFILTLLVVILVLGMLPSTAISMVQELRTQAEGQLFDLFTGEQVPANAAMAPHQTFINVTVTNIDEATMMASLTLSGHRECAITCPETTATLYSLGNDAARRRGLPPSATVTVPPDEGSYTYQVQLPIRGKPQRYPFDDYTLLLGVVVENTFAGGITLPVTRTEVAARTVSFTLEDLVTRLDMAPPRTVDPAAVRSPNDPTEFMLVDELQWQRPRYLRILTALLVLLISASGIFALGLRSLHELVLGIGGIILGIWGVRSVVVQSPLPDVTLIDLVLGFVMLILMLALAVRAARYFYLRSGLVQWRAARRARGTSG
ncbi:MAG: hypothetical protein U0Z70_19440 [Thermomicrobiales bacterium]